MSAVVGKPSHSCSHYIRCNLHNAGVPYEAAEDLKTASDNERAKYDRLV